MAITAGMVKELREKTGLGMMDCKKALTESNGDMELAIENLRKKGQATAEKRAGKTATEGAVSAVIEGSTAVIYQVNCETDFVANSDDFVNFTAKLDKALIANKPADLDAAKALDLDGETVDAAATALMGKIGEKVDFKTYELVEAAEGEAVYSYVHSNKKVGALVKLASDNAAILANAEVEELGKDLAMQIAASAPRAISQDELDADWIAKEKEIAVEQLKNEGKPEAMIEKIVIGKMQKLYKDNTLLGQEFIKADKVSVEKHMAEVAKAAGGSLSIATMVRVELGA